MPSGASREIVARSENRVIHWARFLDPDYGNLSNYTFHRDRETGSFTKGADRVAVAQSTISATIAKLEAEFGVPLLKRRSPVVPTSAGQRVF
jgi:Bacterial regulatory helix-turn-helix protein, lysR family